MNGAVCSKLNICAHYLALGWCYPRFCPEYTPIEGILE